MLRTYSSPATDPAPRLPSAMASASAAALPGFSRAVTRYRMGPLYGTRLAHGRDVPPARRGKAREHGGGVVMCVSRRLAAVVVATAMLLVASAGVLAGQAPPPQTPPPAAPDRLPGVMPVQIPPAAQQYLAAAIDALSGVAVSKLHGEAATGVAAVQRDFQQMRAALSN